MARTILGLDMVDTFTSSETWPERGETRLSHRSWAALEPPEPGSGTPLAVTVCPVGPASQSTHPETGEKDLPAMGLTMVKGMNWRMLPRLPCSRQSTHSSMNHWTNWVWVPAVLAPKMEEMSRKRFAVETGKYQKPGRFSEAGGDPSLPHRGQVPTSVSDPTPRPGVTTRDPTGIRSHHYLAPCSAGPSC